MDAIHVSEIKNLLAQVNKSLCVVIHALDTKILIGEIHRPADPVTKIIRKRRTRREMSASGIPPVAGMSNLPEKKREKKVEGES